ncbi:MAG: CheR family methyltransferase [Paludibacter sp.]
MKEINKKLIDTLNLTLGVDVSKYNESFLLNSIQRRIDEVYCNSVDYYLYTLVDNNEEAAAFLSSLQISYSEFFRNPLTFSVIEKILIPIIMLEKTNSKQKEIRIWSAACAAGQETYSLAILLNQFKNLEGEPIKFRIFATDQSEKQIEIARNGVFDKSSLNNISLRHLNEWFIKEGELFRIKPELKQNIDFSVFDLLDNQHNSPTDSIFGDFDLVICANLLFYYKPQFRKLILNKINKSLTTNGYLITGETERDFLSQQKAIEVFPFSAIYRPL